MSKRRIDIPGKGLIQFEGMTLPEGAKYFEAASFYSALPDDIKTWVLDLRYAWGRERRAASSLVLRACDEIERRIHDERETLFPHLRGIFKQTDPAEIYQEWLTAIQVMRECAETRKTCTWTVQPRDGEVAYFRDQMIGLVRAMEKAQSDTALPPGFVDYIKSASEDEQVRFIIQTTDSLSS
jgi:hypothetical protein